MKSLARVLLACVAAGACALPAAAELLSNPGLEGDYAGLAECTNVSGAVAPGWFDNTCWDPTRPQVRYERVAGAPGVHGGGAAQRMTLLSGQRAVLAQVLPVTLPAGQVARTAVWLRAEQPVEVQLMLREPDAPFRVHGARLVTAGPQWVRHEFEALSLGTPAMLMLTLQQPGSVVVDDASALAGMQLSTLPQPPAGPVPRSYFGIHFNDLDTPWPRLGLVPGAVRIWDAGPNRDGSGLGAQWADINPAPGVYRWSALDARVAAARQRGTPVLYVLGGRTPAWASADPGAESPYGPGQCAEPASDAVWAAWIRALATRYAGQIQAYEVWNEPDLPMFYCGRPDRLVDLARIARQVLAEVSPGARLVSPGMSGLMATAWLDRYLAAGGAALVDAVGYHFYVEQRPEDIWHPALGVRRALAAAGRAAATVWNTEQGFFDGEGAVDLLPPDVGAAFVARAMLLNWAWGHERFYFYSWDNARNRVAFTAPDRRTLQAPAIAYREVADWMLQRVMESVQQDGAGNYIVALRGSAGSRRWAVWNPDAQVAFTPPPAWGVRSMRLLGGERRAFTGGSVRVGPAPVLLDTATVP